MNKPILLIDGDPLKYAAGCSIEHTGKDIEIPYIDPVHFGYSIINHMVNKIMKICESDKIQVFLTSLQDTTNFRLGILKEYKDNRKFKCSKCKHRESIKLGVGLYVYCSQCYEMKRNNSPLYKQELHDYIKKKYNALEAIGEEADDLISIRHYELNPLGFNPDIKNTIICSIDKDFNNLPGYHYNPKRGILEYVDCIQAKRNFYLQILTGDRADGIPRIRKGWNRINSEKELSLVLTESDMYDIVKKEIMKVKECDSIEADNIILNRGRLVHLRRYEDELWVPDNKHYMI